MVVIDRTLRMRRSLSDILRLSSHQVGEPQPRRRGVFNPDELAREFQ